MLSAVKVFLTSLVIGTVLGYKTDAASIHDFCCYFAIGYIFMELEEVRNGGSTKR